MYISAVSVTFLKFSYSLLCSKNLAPTFESTLTSKLLFVWLVFVFDAISFKFSLSFRLNSVRNCSISLKLLFNLALNLFSSMSWFNSTKTPSLGIFYILLRKIRILKNLPLSSLTYKRQVFYFGVRIKYKLNITVASNIKSDISPLENFIFHYSNSIEKLLNFFNNLQIKYVQIKNKKMLFFSLNI